MTRPLGRAVRGRRAEALVAPRATLAYTVVTGPAALPTSIGGWGKDLREAVDSDGHGGLGVYVTGDLGFNADFEEVFGVVDTKLLLATVLLVLVLLGAIYRSPLIALIPLVVVGLAYTSPRA